MRTLVRGTVVGPEPEHARVGATRTRFQLMDQFHRLDLRCAGHAPGREGRGNRVDGVARRPEDGRDRLFRMPESPQRRRKPAPVDTIPARATLPRSLRTRSTIMVSSAFSFFESRSHCRPSAPVVTGTVPLMGTLCARSPPSAGSTSTKVSGELLSSQRSPRRKSAARAAGLSRRSRSHASMGSTGRQCAAARRGTPGRRPHAQCDRVRSGRHFGRWVPVGRRVGDGGWRTASGVGEGFERACEKFRGPLRPAADPTGSQRPDGSRRKPALHLHSATVGRMPFHG